jgi:hypothetical protein
VAQHQCKVENRLHAPVQAQAEEEIAVAEDKAARAAAGRKHAQFAAACAEARVEQLQAQLAQERANLNRSASAAAELAELRVAALLKARARAACIQNPLVFLSCRCSIPSQLCITAMHAAWASGVMS